MAGDPTGALVYVDESWFSLWPITARAWSPGGEPLRVPQRWDEKVPTCALYAALDVFTEQLYWQWRERTTRWETWAFLQDLLAHYQAQGRRYLVVIWDNASFHKAKDLRLWRKAYNQKAKQQGRIRLLVVFLPVRSPWLMPLEAIFGRTKERVQFLRMLPDLESLQLEVGAHLGNRNHQRAVEMSTLVS